jgi:FkbM family methyltransferase
VINDKLPCEDNARSDVESGQYEKHCPLVPGLKVLDLGAHVGYFSERALKSGCQVKAFEPHPKNFKRLIERCGIYFLFEGINAAAGDDNCRNRPFFNCPPNSGAHGFFQNETHDPNPIEVSVIDIGDWCLKNFIPDFVKIDTEGCELQIMQSLMKAKLYPYIAYEAHSLALWAACNSLLIQNGYRSFGEGPVVGINWGIPNV